MESSRGRLAEYKAEIAPSTHSKVFGKIITPGSVFENHVPEKNNHNNNKQPANQKGNHPPETTTMRARNG